MAYTLHRCCTFLCYSEGGQSYIILGLHGKALPGVLQDMIFVYKCQGSVCCCASSRDYNCLHLEKTLKLQLHCHVLSVPTNYGMAASSNDSPFHLFLIREESIHIDNTSSRPCESGRTVKHIHFPGNVVHSTTSSPLIPPPVFQLPLLATSCNLSIPM